MLCHSRTVIKRPLCMIICQLYNMWLSVLVSVIGVTATCVILFFKWKFSYWKKRGVFTLPPEIPFGNAKDLVLGRKYQGDEILSVYREIKSKNLRYGGYYSFTQPVFVPADIELIRRILITDFQHFTDHGTYIDEENDPISGDLFAQTGPKWKALRNKLTPSFSSAKLKMIFETLSKNADGFPALLDEYERKQQTFDIKDIFSRYTIDVIASVAFGIECNCLKDPNAEFRRYALKILEPPPLAALRLFLLVFVPNLAKLFKLSFVKKDVEKFFTDVVKQTAEYRDKNNIERKDIMQSLLKLRNTEIKLESNRHVDFYQNGLSIDEVTAQIFFFFIAGYETSATTLNFLMYELVTHPEIQDKLRREVVDVLKKFKGELSYETISEMKYMEMCILETLRKYPPVAAMQRMCTKTYKVPYSDLVIPKDTLVAISAYGIHHDPEFYPDPEKFDPERFTEENQSKRPPASFLGFGEGPRICIGLRLALLQTKVGLASLIKDFEFSLNSKTKRPMTFDPKQFILTAEGGVWVDARRIQNST